MGGLQKSVLIILRKKQEAIQRKPKKKMYRGIIIFLFLSCISLPFGATNPGRKSYVTINESEAHLVQENIDYKKIATITTPKNLDVEYTKADMADPRKIILEDPLDLNNRNVASANDALDYEEPRSGRVRRECRTANGDVITRCHELRDICNNGCPIRNTRFKCTPRGGGRSHVLWNCGLSNRNAECLGPLMTQTCTICCTDRNCRGRGMPSC